MWFYGTATKHQALTLFIQWDQVIVEFLVFWWILKHWQQSIIEQLEY